MTDRNDATFVTSMFLDGNYTSSDTYHEVREFAANAGGNVHKLGDELKGYVESEIDGARERLGNCLANDLLGAALREIDWPRLAEAILSE